jgi:hypothetical protein
MKLIKPTLFLGLVAAVLSAGAIASNSPLFAGYWNLYSGPYYAAPELPQLYTGQQAAAALFGGNPGDYVISTLGRDVAAIDYQAWYDESGFAPHVFPRITRTTAAHPACTMPGTMRRPWSWTIFTRARPRIRT